MAKKIAHIGVAVSDLSDAVKVFATILGQDPDGLVEVFDQKVRVANFTIGDNRIELLEGTAKVSSISKYLEKHGPGIHHVAVQVDDIEKELDRLKKAGIRLIDETPRIGAGGLRIAFLHPKSTAGILIELQERSD
jgi:methylmalonyl-CoA/ethylmalonyl-CoA epimerase